MLIVWSSHVQVAINFFYTCVWIPLIQLKEAINRVAGILSLACPSQVGEMCAICLMEFAREDDVSKLPGCGHVFHLDCINKWIEKSNFTCPLCRCFFNLQNSQEKFCFLVPDNPSCLYYFMQ